jgi:release factor glutamine methyltransferase
MSEPAQTWTVRTLLAWARGWLERRGVESPRLDAELILAHALGCDRVRLYVEHDKPLTPEELARVKPLLQRRAEREPVAYILGSKEFYGRAFAVGKGVFVPRPETELLVQQALEALDALAGPQRLDAGGLRVLDLCAGSGAVGVTLAAERAGLEVDLVELSADAAAFARSNAQALAPGRARVLEGDLFAPLGPAEPRYDAVVANPPYVPAGDEARLQPEIAHHEPRQALYAGERGLDVLQSLIAAAPQWMRPGAFFGVELDPGQPPAVLEMCRAAGFEAVRVVQDLARLDRFVTARLPGPRD